MDLNKDLELSFMSEESTKSCEIVCNEIEILFNSVMATVIDYFEEA